jgi:hypothetical protein
MLLLLTFVALGTSLIWSGLGVIDARTLLFAAVALVARTAVLYPVLSRVGVRGRDRQLIALFGPRGLSSLLLTLLPIFAGIPGAERLFSVTCLVVLLSVLLHGSGIALFLRADMLARAREGAAVGPLTPLTEAAATAAAAGGATKELITPDEVRALRAGGEPVVIVDARTDRSYAADDLEAVGAIRIHPDDPVRDATERRLSQRSTLVVYCA